MKRMALIAVIMLASGLILLFLSDFSIAEGASDFTLVDIDGSPFTLSKQRGKVVLLEFMTTTCDICKAETEVLKVIEQKYSESDLVIISVSVGSLDNNSVLRDYKEIYEANWVFAMDNGSVALSYRVRSVPHMYFIDGKGRIASSHLGFLDSREISSRIDQAISLTDLTRTVVLPILSFSLVAIAFSVFFYLAYANRELIKKQLFGDSDSP